MRFRHLHPEPAARSKGMLDLPSRMQISQSVKAFGDSMQDGINKRSCFVQGANHLLVEITNQNGDSELVNDSHE